MEIGSFLELDLKNTGEYFKAEKLNVARLNSGRSGIFHALKMLNCSVIYIPFYLCPDVKGFLEEQSVEVRQYQLDNNFEPVLGRNENNSAVLIVNHYGLLSETKMREIASRFLNPVIDNCASFFSKPITEFYNVYSCRKFFGVPDGSYVVGPGAGLNCSGYRKDSSSDTSLFLLKRIEKGSETTYHERMLNEHRINISGVLRMSRLTQSLLNSLDYEAIKARRLANFNYAVNLFKSHNLLDIKSFADQNTIPLFYPLCVRYSDLVSKLQKRKIYTGRRWTSVLKEVSPKSFEAFLSEYMVPMPIDQRYGRKEISYCFKVFLESISISIKK